MPPLLQDRSSSLQQLLGTDLYKRREGSKNEYAGSSRVRVRVRVRVAYLTPIQLLPKPDGHQKA